MPANHVVAQGECLSSIAKKYGISDWRSIYNAPENAGFRQKRSNPNILCPGDSLVIPDPQLRTEDKPADQLHTFVRKSYKTTIHIVVEDEMGKPFKSTNYDLKVGEESYQGTTGGDGSITQEISADETSGELTIHASGGGYSWTLDIGHLDPDETDDGVKGRLHNLGFDVDSGREGFDEQAVIALKAFQYAAGLPVTGTMDDTTRNKLLKLHDRV
jgi:hypothetical protein